MVHASVKRQAAKEVRFMVEIIFLTTGNRGNHLRKPCKGINETRSSSEHP